MNISVILCTYNRSQSLRGALKSVVSSEMEDSVSWEVLVVDNNSTDETRGVVQEYVDRYPARFRYLFESEQGKSHALNAGIRQAAGEILAFMDDDVAVDARWLQTLTAVLKNEPWCGVGGRILPERTFTPPSWLSSNDRYALAPLAIFDLGAEASELFEAPFGTNMAFRREVFERLGGFRTDLGPCPGSEIRGEDTEFGDRVLAQGLRMWYEPSAIVFHSLSMERLKKDYFLAWWYDKARSDLRQYGVPGSQSWSLAGIPLVLLGRLCVWCLRWLFAMGAAKKFSCKLAVWKVTATIRESRRLHLRASNGLSTSIPEL